MGGFCKFWVGDGTRVRFWHDRCCGDDMLKVRFPGLYEIACDKDVMVADYLGKIPSF